MEILINLSIDGRPSASFVGFIDASPQDLRGQKQGMIAANERLREGGLDSVLQARQDYLLQ